MKYIVEKELSDFEFWGGAKDNAKEFSRCQLDRIGEELERINPDRMLTEGEINDYMWFEPEFLAEIIGMVWEDGEPREPEEEEEEEDYMQTVEDGWQEYIHRGLSGPYAPNHNKE